MKNIPPEKEKEWLIKSQELITNLYYWISNGKSETAVENINKYWQEWRVMTSSIEAQRAIDKQIEKYNK